MNTSHKVRAVVAAGALAVAGAFFSGPAAAAITYSGCADAASGFCSFEDFFNSASGPAEIQIQRGSGTYRLIGDTGLFSGGFSTPADLGPDVVLDTSAIQVRGFSAGSQLGLDISMNGAMTASGALGGFLAHVIDYAFVLVTPGGTLAAPGIASVFDALMSIGVSDGAGNEVVVDGFSQGFFAAGDDVGFGECGFPTVSHVVSDLDGTTSGPTAFDCNAAEVRNFSFATVFSDELFGAPGPLSIDTLSHRYNVPEPASAALVLAGLGALGLRRRHNQKRS